MANTTLSSLLPKRTSTPQCVGLAMLAVLFLIAPLFFYPVFLMKVMCFSILALSVNLLLGYGGLLSFGHAAFFGASAYTFGYVSKVLEWGTGLSFLAALAVGTTLGVIFGFLAIRRLGIYFAMTTLALAQIVYFFCLQAPFTGGEDGLQGIPRGSLFGVDLLNNNNLYIVIFIIFMASLLFVYRIINSPFGDILKAIRENSARATSLGYKPAHYKLIAFVLSTFLASVAGASKALVFQIATLSDVHWMMSGDAVLMALVGGVGTLFGPVLGAIFIVMLHDGLAAISFPIVIIQGALFIACVTSFRLGIMGEISRVTRRNL